jgi:hypothetical protein
MENLKMPVSLPMAWMNTQTVQMEINALTASSISEN